MTRLRLTNTKLNGRETGRWPDSIETIVTALTHVQRAIRCRSDVSAAPKMSKTVWHHVAAAALTLAVVSTADAADTGYVRPSSVTIDADGLANNRGNAYFKVGNETYFCKKSITDSCLKILLTALAADRQVKAFYHVKSSKATEVYAVRIH